MVEVSAAPPVVETERGSQANTITQEYIEDLPIDRRDYLNFTLLLPGVSDSTRLADDQDFRVKQTPQSGLSFYGSNGRGNSVTVDGGETRTMPAACASPSARTPCKNSRSIAATMLQTWAARWRLREHRDEVRH